MTVVTAATSAPAPRTALWGAAALAAVVACAGVSLGASFTQGVKYLTFVGIAMVLAAPLRAGVGLIGAALLATIDSFARVLVFKGGFLPWNTFGYVLLAVLLLLLPRVLPHLRGAPVLIGGALFVLLLVELVPSVQRLEGTQHLFGLFAFFAFLAIAHHAAADRDAWLWAGIVAAVAGILFGVVYLAHGSPFENVNKNAWAYVPLTGVALLCPAMAVAGDRRGVRVLLTALSALDTTVVFLSESRGTFLVALVLFAFVLASGAETTGRRVARVAATLLVALPLAVLFAVAFPDKARGMTERMDVLGDQSRSLANRTSGRSELARIGWEIAREHPLGIGTGSFSAESGTYGSREALLVFHGGRELEAHSGWVKTLAENGFPGILLLAAFVGSFAAAGHARRARGVFGLGLLASVVLAIAFASTEFQAKGIWLFAAVVAMALERGRVRAPAAAPEAAPLSPPAFDPWRRSA